MLSRRRCLSEDCPPSVMASPSLQHKVTTWRTIKRRDIVLIIVILAAALGVAVAFLVHHVTAFVGSQSGFLIPPDPEVTPPPSTSEARRFRKSAVCVDSQACAVIGSNILESNGSAVDATIAALLCNGLINSHSMGIGGGFFMTIYSEAEKKGYVLNAREAAPAAAKVGMFETSKEAQIGPKSVCVPGEIRGYWEAHRRFGRLPWREVVAPAVKLCRNGYHMTRHQFDSLYRNQNVYKDATLRSIFVDPANGEFRQAGSLIKPAPTLCNTLQQIADRGGDDLYNGSLAEDFAQDLIDAGTIISAQDLSAYRAEWVDPITVELRDGIRLLSVPPPGSGILLAFMLAVLDGFGMDSSSIADIPSTIETYHRIIETYKHAFAMRTKLGDPDFVDISKDLSLLTNPEYAKFIRSRIGARTQDDLEYYGAKFFTSPDSGTAHISVLSADGDAVSVTSTLDIYFGSGVTAPRTGILLNSGMDDFSWSNFPNYFNLPGTLANTVAPGKRPLSSMSPSVLVDRNGDVRMVIGASGGTKMPMAIAYVIVRHLWFGEPIKKAIDAARIYHQLVPADMEYEYGVVDGVIRGLQSLGHHTVRGKPVASVICALAKLRGMIEANADYRKAGDVSGI